MIEYIKRICLTSVICLSAVSMNQAYARDQESLKPTEETAKEENDKGKYNQKSKSKGKEKKDKDLQSELTELRNSIAAKESLIQAMQEEINSLKQDLQEIIPFRIEMLKNLCQDIDDLERLPFSSISLQKTDSISIKIKPFLSSSPELTESDIRLTKLTERKAAYDSMLHSINTKPYGEGLETEFKEFKEKLSAVDVPAQQMEISELENTMKSYPTLISEFSKVIDEFQLQLEYARNHNDLSDAKDMAKVTFDMNENFKAAKEKMKGSQYMSTLLEEYLTNLSGSNPLDERIIRIEETVASMAAALPKTTKNK